MKETKPHISVGGLQIGFKTPGTPMDLVIPECFREFYTEVVQETDVTLYIRDVASLTDRAEWPIKGSVVSGVDNEKISLPPSMIPPGSLWEVRQLKHNYRISTWSHTGDRYLPVWIDYSPEKQVLTIHTELLDGTAYPMGFPAGGLIIYLISALYPSILIHGSLVDDRGKGYLFCGVSGSGKSTMARLWDEEGARVIHDDRILIRKVNGRWMAFSTPVNPGDHSGSVELHSLFLIKHGDKNRAERISQMDAFSGILEHCIQHQYDRRMIGRLVDTLQALADQVPVSRLAFVNDHRIVTYLRDLYDE